MHIQIITLFPEMFSALEFGITGRAINQGLLKLDYYNPRNFAQDKHKTVDDRPYGGGPGMVMLVEPLQSAINTAKKATQKSTKVIYLSPQGKPLTQAVVNSLTSETNLIFVTARYEGLDERLLESEIDEEISIGDYVLSGGELPAMVLIDAMVRILPEALGHQDSALQDSFQTGLLDHPHYTRPRDINGKSVPEVLLSGDHQAIEKWRKKKALGATWLKRPDLLAKRQLTTLEKKLLNEFIQEFTMEKSNE